MKRSMRTALGIPLEALCRAEMSRANLSGLRQDTCVAVLAKKTGPCERDEVSASTTELNPQLRPCLLSDETRNPRLDLLR